MPYRLWTKCLASFVDGSYKNIINCHLFLIKKKNQKLIKQLKNIDLSPVHSGLLTQFHVRQQKNTN